MENNCALFLRLLAFAGARNCPLPSLYQAGRSIFSAQPENDFTAFTTPHPQSMF
jgi:hypothetical protein